jgi:hypothetical protein
MALMLSQPRIDTSSPVVANAAFDPPAVRPGEPTTYRVTLNALEESIEWPAKIPAPSQLTLRPGAHAQILQMAGNVLAPQTTFNSRGLASVQGEITVPEFLVNVYGKPVKIPAAKLYVVPTVPPTVPPAQRLLLDLPDTNLFAGETIRARIVLPGSERGVVQGLAQVQLTGDGWLVDQGSARPRIEPLRRNGNNMIAFIYELLVTPIASGKLSMFAQGYASGSHYAGPIVMAGPQYTLLDSDPVDILVRPLPREGQLPGFTGAIGSFSLDTPHLSANTVKVGELLKLTVAVGGDAGLSRLVPPPCPTLRNWQVFPSERAPLPPHAPPGLVIAFSFTLIPLSTEPRATPAIPFSYFDPKRPGYVDLTIPSLPVQVLPGAFPADLQAVHQAAKLATETENEPALTGLAPSPGRSVASLVPVQQQAWFPLMQIVPAALFVGLALWDHRRRYLEQHPEVVLRRRARRALRREWRAVRRAARAGEAAGFATAAVSAMQVACAPHFPAEARALVGQDVLEALPEAARSARVQEAVRRFFTITDANRFARQAGDARELLALEPQLELVLRELEAKLVA